NGAIVRRGNECMPIRHSAVPRDAVTKIKSQPTAAEFRSESLEGWPQLWSCKNFSLFGRCQRVLLGRKLRLLSSTFTLDTSAVSLASRRRSIAVFPCSSGGRLFLRIIAPGLCL